MSQAAKTCLFVLAFLFILVFAEWASVVQLEKRVSTSYAAAEIDKYKLIYKRQDLPSRGELFPNLQNPSELYYFYQLGLYMNHKSGDARYPDLYHSVDGGATWRLVSPTFCLRDFFVNPKTGKLFGITQVAFTVETKEGFLETHFGGKVMTSLDGQNWKDITGTPKYIGGLCGIFQDPDHPDRICLDASSVNPYVLQAKDADYSGWNWIRYGIDLKNRAPKRSRGF